MGSAVLLMQSLLAFPLVQPAVHKGAEVCTLSDLGWQAAENGACDSMQHCFKPSGALLRWQGVLPSFIQLSSGEWSSGTLTIGAMGDSYYEYLLKLWLLKQPQVGPHFSGLLLAEPEQDAAWLFELCL